MFVISYKTFTIFAVCYNNLYDIIYILAVAVCNNNIVQDNGEAGVDCGGGGCHDCRKCCIFLT